MCYVGYTFNGRVLGKHENYKVLCDLAYLEQQDNFSILAVDDYYAFFSLPIESLFKIFIHLGGNKQQFKNGNEIRAARQRIWKECKEIICGYPNSQINAFELEQQIGWLEQQVQKSGYRYNPGSRFPKLV